MLFSLGSSARGQTNDINITFDDSDDMYYKLPAVKNLNLREGVFTAESTRKYLVTVTVGSLRRSLESEYDFGYAQVKN